MFNPKKILQFAMFANALFSFVSGIVSISISKQLMAMFALSDNNLFIYLGTILILYAIWMVSTALQKTINLNSARAIIMLDVLWVISSTIIISKCNVSDKGLILIVAIAIVVLLFAIAQFIGLYKKSF